MSLLVGASPFPAHAETLGYPEAAIQCVHAPYATSGTGYWCSGYSWGTQRDNDSYSSILSGRGYVYRNCTDYVAWKLQSLGVPDSLTRSLGNGGEWYARAGGKPGLSRGTSPKAGAAAVKPSTDADIYGHVAYVEKVNRDSNGNITTIEISEYNRGLDGNGSRRIGTAASMGFTHFVYFGAHMTNPPSDGGTPTVTNPDFNGDQYGDLAWHQGTNLTLFMSLGNGTFGYVGSTGGIGTPTWAGAGDVNGDKQVDVIWYTGTTLAVFKWGGSGWSWANQTTGIGAPDYAVVGDFNGDGRADLAWHSGTTLTLFTGTGNTFAYGGATGGIGTPQWARAANVNGGTKDELVWYRNNAFTTLGWNGSGWGWVNTTSGIGAATSAAAGDFTGDGRDDIAWYQGTTLRLYGGLPDGKFGYVGATSGIGAATWTGATDVNKDGKSDVIWYQGTTIHTFSWTGSGWGWMGGTPGIGTPGFAVASG